ncbi:MAG TPA: TPM domain-containing protein [Bauldia sp.]|nr:TPM domain-containing protein [Bauldia sp.]
MRHMPLSDAERARVRDAVASAEAKTAGEIFTVVAEQSDDYRFVPLLWAMLAALVVPLPLIFLTLWPASLIFSAQLAGFAVLAIVLSLPPVKMAVVPASVKRDAVRAMAGHQFLAHGLTNTERRTGVLIFVSLVERQAEIIADTGIAAKVSADVWQAAMDQLLAEVRAGRLADGLIAAARISGKVLADHFPPRPDDRDELPDDVVIL